MMPDYYDTNVCESGCNTPQMQLYQQKLSGVRFNVTLITLQVILEIFPVSLLTGAKKTQTSRPIT